MDGVVLRRVVGEVPGTVFLCNESEFQSAQIERREPTAIGFPAFDIVLNDDDAETDNLIG